MEGFNVLIQVSMSLFVLLNVLIQVSMSLFVLLNS